jgi:hypothetical protein
VAIVFALPRLFDAIVERFDAEGTDVPQLFGWLAVNEQIHTTARIVWSPGDPGGNLGAIGPGKYPGQNPRQLATLEELCTVEIFASNLEVRDDERAQYQAARELFDAWLRAVYLAAHGTFKILSASWVGGDRAHRMGATLRVVFSIQAPVTDEPITITQIQADAAVLSVAELDVTESLTVTPAPAA